MLSRPGERDDLDQRFVGDEYWSALVAASEERWAMCHDKGAVTRATLGRVDFAKAVWACCADGYLAWLTTPHPDISNQRPFELLASSAPAGLMRLRALVMQFPP